MRDLIAVCVITVTTLAGGCGLLVFFDRLGKAEADVAAARRRQP